MKSVLRPISVMTVGLVIWQGSWLVSCADETAGPISYQSASTRYIEEQAATPETGKTSTTRISTTTSSQLPPNSDSVTSTSVFTDGIESAPLDEQYAYEACRTIRLGELGLVDRYSRVYPYTNQHMDLLLSIGFWGQSIQWMERAASANSVWQPYVSELRKSQTTVSRRLSTFLDGRSQEKYISEWQPQFSQLCTEFGIWPTERGKYAPVEFEWTPVPKDALTGARKICRDLFYSSRDEEVFNGNDAFSLDECDVIAKAIAERTEREASTQSNPSDFAERWMKSEVFSKYEYWCWGSECVSKDDI